MKQRKGRLVRSYFRDIREGLLEEAVFEKRPEGVSSGGDTTRQRGNSKCKGPEAGICLNKEFTVVEVGGDEDSEPASGHQNF